MGKQENNQSQGAPRDLSRPPAFELHNDHNVYVLGAGFSADAGMPLMADFLLEMKRTLVQLEENKSKHRREITALKFVLKFHGEAQNASHYTNFDLDNIEVLFSLASIYKGKVADDQMRLAIAVTLDSCLRATTRTRKILVEKELSAQLDLPREWAKRPERYNDKHDSWDIPMYHVRAGLMCGALCAPSRQRKTSIITFNYDTLVEDSLREMGIPFNLFGNGLQRATTPEGVFASRAGEVDVYKMHGSINWGDPSTGKAPTEYSDYEAVTAAGLLPITQPPTWRKDFGDLFTNIWEGARDALHRATRLIVIGFSMPATDLYARYLIAAGLAGGSVEQIQFVCSIDGFDEFEKRVFQCFRPELRERGKLKFFTAGADNFFDEVGYGLTGLSQTVEIGRAFAGSPFLWP